LSVAFGWSSSCPLHIISPWPPRRDSPEIRSDNGTPARANCRKGNLYVGKHKISRRIGPFRPGARSVGIHNGTFDQRLTIARQDEVHCGAGGRALLLSTKPEGDSIARQRMRAGCDRRDTGPRQLGHHRALCASLHAADDGDLHEDPSACARLPGRNLNSVKSTRGWSGGCNESTIPQTRKAPAGQLCDRALNEARPRGHHVELDSQR